MAKTFSPFRIHKSKNGQFFFTIVSKNGNTIVTSETYTRKVNCINAVKAVWSVCGTSFPVLYIDTTK